MLRMLPSLLTGMLLLLAATNAIEEKSGTCKEIICPVPGNPSTITEEECSQYSACCYSSDAGFCHMKGNKKASYYVATEPIVTDTGYTTTLKKINDSITLFGGDISELQFEVIYHEDYHVQIRITDPANVRYEVPIPLSVASEVGTNRQYEVSVPTKDEHLGFHITRISNGNNILSLLGPLTFEDQFLQLSLKLSSEDLYGFGENIHRSLRHTFTDRQTYGMFARDQIIDTNEPYANHYGSFPYFVNVEDDDGNTHSVLLMNSNAMEYSIFPTSDGDAALTLRAIGGIIDIHVFTGPTPEDVNVQYANAVGKPAFPPYWALGFHLSRWGYGSTDNVRTVRNRMREAAIPQDMQVFDIDYMDQRRDFTFDPVNFTDLPELVSELRSENIRTTVILDPAIPIKTDEGYEPFTRGRDVEAYIKWLHDDLVPPGQDPDAENYIVGNVWPDEPTVFPDFFKPETQAWWAEEISTFRQKVPFDALWIDMNEPANFNTNLGPTWLNCPNNTWDNPPYPTITTSLDNNESGRLSEKTICMSGQQTDGVNIFKHYDVHSLYGYSETVATFNALKKLQPSSRPVVLSRSTFPGSGRYAVHWLGDNSATWEQMRLSVIGMIEFNMFGMPMVGADICGFFGAPSMELCARWTQLGAFYPFSRNHNSLGEPDQDPAVWPQVATIAADVLSLRYRYLPTLYTLFHDAHMHGNSVIRPLFNVFPSDNQSRSVDDQFLWGDKLMVAPVLHQGAVDRNVYFPQGLWYSLVTGALQATGPLTVKVSAPLEEIPVYVRGGSVLPYQEPALTTDLSRLNDFGLLVALDSAGASSGEVFWDDGQEEHVMSETFLAQLNYSDSELTMTISYDPAAAEGITLAKVNILGLSAVPTSVTVNGAPFEDIVVDTVNNVLTLNTNLPLNQELHVVLS